MKDFDYLNVPIPILEYSLKYKRTREIALWLFLKSFTSGHFNLKKNKIVKASMYFVGIKSRSTFNKYLDWLLRSGLLTYNSNSKSYRLVSMKSFSMKIDNSNYIGALIYREDFRNFKEFAFSAIASNLIRRGLRKENRAGLKSGRAWKSRHPSNPSYFQLSNIIFSKVLSISKSTVTRLKKSASETGYLNVKKVIYPIRPHPKIKIGLNEINFLRQYGDYDPNTLRITNHFQIAVQEPDLIASNVITRVVKPLKGLVHKS